MTSYYVSQRHILLDGFDSMFDGASPMLANLCDEAAARIILVETRREFERLIPELPYIGGWDNPLTGRLVMAAWYTAFFIVTRRAGWSEQQAYCVLYEIVGHWLAHSTWLGRGGQEDTLSEPQTDTRPSEWIDVRVGVHGRIEEPCTDYETCGICTFLREQDEIGLLSYICALDLPVVRKAA